MDEMRMNRIINKVIGNANDHLHLGSEPDFLNVRYFHANTAPQSIAANSTCFVDGGGFRVKYDIIQVSAYISTQMRALLNTVCLRVSVLRNSLPRRNTKKSETQI